MIGQTALLRTIDANIATGFPRFSLLVGPQGGGKKMVVDYVATCTGFTKVVCGNKVDDIRGMMQTLYGQTENILYVFYDIDDMSVNAKNALLKVTEEPPHNAYFIMTVSSESRALETILSRAVRFNLDSYSTLELLQYYRSLGHKGEVNEENLLCVVEVPGDINALLNYDFEKFYTFCEAVVENIADVEMCNAFKIVEKLSLKDKDDGWDIKLFLNAVKNILLEKHKKDSKYPAYRAIGVCNDFLNQLSNKSLNKRMLCDSWVIKIREALL